MKTIIFWYPSTRM